MASADVRPTAVPNRTLAVVLVVGALIVLAVALVAAVIVGAMGVLDEESGGVWAYVLIGVFVAGDAIIPIFPSESIMNTASVLAADSGNLAVEWIIVASALGAIIGDSLLYWIARLDLVHLKSKVDELSKNEKAARALDVLNNNYGLLIVFGRYVPGLRFVVNATCGMVGVPYPTFIKWSILAAIVWSTYTCLVSYWVGDRLSDNPLASILISGVLTAAILAGVGWVVFRKHKTQSSSPA